MGIESLLNSEFLHILLERSPVLIASILIFLICNYQNNKVIKEIRLDKEKAIEQMAQMYKVCIEELRKNFDIIYKTKK